MVYSTPHVMMTQLFWLTYPSVSIQYRGVARILIGGVPAASEIIICGWAGVVGRLSGPRGLSWKEMCPLPCETKHEMYIPMFLIYMYMYNTMSYQNEINITLSCDNVRSDPYIHQIKMTVLV